MSLFQVTVWHVYPQTELYIPVSLHRRRKKRERRREKCPVPSPVFPLSPLNACHAGYIPVPETDKTQWSLHLSSQEYTDYLFVRNYCFQRQSPHQMLHIYNLVPWGTSNFLRCASTKALSSYATSPW